MMLSALRRVARPAAARSFAAYTPARTWQVYLSGEIHSDWREVIAAGVADRKLPVELGAPITSHEDSDDCGAVILGDEASRPNYDGKGARLNLIRARTGRQARATFPTSQAPSSTVVLAGGTVLETGRTRVIQRRFNVSVPRAPVLEKASMLRERSER